MADRAFLEDETLFGMGWTVPWDGNSQAASAQGDALAQQVEVSLNTLLNGSGI